MSHADYVFFLMKDDALHITEKPLLFVKWT
jgi:hypothetical protein